MNGEQSIRFLLDGEVQTVAGLPPTTTVLEWLREHRGRTGTKEGCAEGDCGACTVVIAELAGERLRFRAINACIRFLPTLDGKALLPVESLGSATRGALHPVQRAMVECHGSQCGFCTPGFVMSLYALYRSERGPDDGRIRHVICGNLCRCTGYRPILAAARRMYEYPSADTARQDAELCAGLLAIRVTREKRLSEASGSYVAPFTEAELAAALAARPGAVILAGGTDLALRVTKLGESLPDIVYVGNVASLGSIGKTAEALEIGAGVSLTEAFEALVAEYPALAEIARRFASPPICHSGTLCGNVANGSPIGDTMPALIALGAEVVLRGAPGARRLPLEDFYLGYQRKDLRPGEFVAAVRVPRARDGRIVRSYKVGKRYDQDISAVCAAFAVDLAAGRVGEARVCFGGMAAVPQRARACERALAGAEWSAQGVAAAVAALAQDFEPITDFRASRGYRLKVAGNLLRRCVADDGRAAVRVWSHAV